MSSLILVTCDSGAGHLKVEKRADRILTFIHRLVTIPVPTDGPPETFFQRSQAICEADDLFHEPWLFQTEDVDSTNSLFKRIWSRLPETCLRHDRVELWIDPDANAQLVLLQLLDWLGHVPEIMPRLWLKQSDSPLGARRPGDWVLPPRPVELVDVALASRAWAAFGAPTPEKWLALRGDPDLDQLPGLRRTVALMLDELPDRTGLGATERRILKLAEREGWWDEAARRGTDMSSHALATKDRLPLRLIHRVLQWGERLPSWHFEVGETLCGLGTAPAPALSGITERHFTLDMHQDEDRFRPFRETPLSLTELGYRLVTGDDNWSRHNRIHRWWGGTRLTNETLWRWDAEKGRLSPPN